MEVAQRGWPIQRGQWEGRQASLVRSEAQETVQPTSTDFPDHAPAP